MWQRADSAYCVPSDNPFQQDEAQLINTWFGSIHRAGDKLFGTFRVTGIDHAGKPFDRYGIDLYELKDGKIALKDSYLKAD